MLRQPVVIFISKAQPSLLRPADLETGTVKKASWTVLGIFAVAALLCGATLSWFASAYPDGLEWSVAGVTGSEETRLAEPSPLHRNLETVQEATAIMPEYAFPADDGANTAETEASSSIVNPETSMAGVLGSAIIAALIFAAGFLFGQKTAQPLPPLTLPMPLFTDASQQFRQMDRFSCGNTGIHRLDARIKIGAFLVYQICVLSWPPQEITGLLPFFLFPVCVIQPGGPSPGLPSETYPVAAARRRHDRPLQPSGGQNSHGRMVRHSRHAGHDLLHLHHPEVHAHHPGRLHAVGLHRLWRLSAAA